LPELEVGVTGLETRSQRSRRLGMGNPITRRDFIDGIAISAALAGSSRALAAVNPDAVAAAPQDRPGYYPPSLTGMRGSHPGSFEAPTRSATALSANLKPRQSTRGRTTI
jgi:hypothetical protein